METPNCYLCKDEPQPAEVIVHSSTAKTPYKPLCKKHLETFERVYKEMKQNSSPDSPLGNSVYEVIPLEDGIKLMEQNPST